MSENENEPHRETDAFLPKWDETIQYVSQVDDLDSLEKHRARVALSHIRGILDDGTGVLRPDHPVMWELCNRAPWVYRWIYWLSELTRACQSAPHFDRILERLRDPKRAGEALSVLTAAGALIRTGLKIDFDVPFAGQSGSVPDLLIENSEASDSFFGEVSILFQADEERRSWDQMHSITDLFFPSNGGILLFSGELLRNLSAAQLNEVVERTKAAISLSQKENDLKEVMIEGVIKIGIAPPEHAELLMAWSKRHSVAPNQFSTPGGQVDQLGRLKRKVAEKAKQLPAGQPNLVIIQSSEILPRLSDPGLIVPAVEEVLFDKSNICALVLRSRGFASAPLETSLAFGMHGYKRRKLIDNMIEENFVFLNKYCLAKISPASLAKIFSAFV